MKVHKYYVDVDTRITYDGRLIPLVLHWKDHPFRIDKVVSVRETYSRAGGGGICYKCRFNGQDRLLFWERNRWFLETEVCEPAMEDQNAAPERKQTA